MLCIAYIYIYSVHSQLNHKKIRNMTRNFLKHQIEIHETNGRTNGWLITVVDEI